MILLVVRFRNIMVVEAVLELAWSSVVLLLLNIIVSNRF
jgi:hypothetical protein